MNPFLVAFLTLLTLAIVDFTSIFFKLGISGVARGFRFLFLGEGYRKESYSVENQSAVKILIIGDSTVFGPGADPRETLAARIADKYKVTVVNRSKNGGTTREITRQLEGVQKGDFNLVMVFAGNNDIWKFTAFKRLESEVSELLDAAKAVCDRVLVFRGGNIGNCPFFPIIFSRIYTYRSRKVRDIFMKVAHERGILYVEKWMERKDDVFLKDPRGYYSWDLLHLNGNGFMVWFEYLDQKMKEAGVHLA